ncbi:MAG: hypothetical protein E7326_03495 [Clostridiales bacterium]|nr:hypothetical protein [Clostridiales bacterium]
MKKSTLLTIVALVLALAMGVSGTMAYLQDTDDDVNVMTLGNVDIEQIELERDEEGNLQNFTQNKDMYPAVGTYAWDPELVYWPDVSATASSPVFDDEKLANVVDKFVFVENTGKSDAYVRTIFAFEVGEYDFNTVIGHETSPLVHINNNDKNTSETEKVHWDFTWFETPVTIDGNKYVLAEALYLGANSKQGTPEEGILVPGATSYPSLLQLFLDPSATNEDMVKLDGNANGTYDVLVVSQAVQTAGFADAKTALNTAFGTTSATCHPWMAEADNGQPPYIESPVFPGMVTNNEELAAAIANGETEIKLAAGEYNIPAAAKGKTLTLTGVSPEKTTITVVPAGQGEANGQLDYNLDGSTVTFNDLTIKTNSQLYAGYARLSADYNNCVIQNTYNLGANSDNTFTNCTINISNEYLRVNGAAKATFDKCTFNTDGRAILVYQDGSNIHQEVTVKDCTFNATAPAKTWNGIHVAAVSIDGTNGTYTVNLEGTNTVDADFNGLWQIKTGDANVTVNE